MQNERLDDLEFGGYKIIQDKNGYCFTSDSVILANSVNVKRTDRVVDLGTGSGIIATVIAGKFRPAKVIGVELQRKLADMAERSVKLNRLDDVITIVNAPAQGVEKLIGDGFDVVVSNPPYEISKNDVKSEATEKDICKKEIFLTAQETVQAAARLLKYGGLFYMINRITRLTDVICAMRENGIEPKKLTLLQPKPSKDIDTFIVEGKKGARPYIVVPKPVIVWNEDGTMTDYIRRLYSKL